MDVIVRSTYTDDLRTGIIHKLANVLVEAGDMFFFHIRTGSLDVEDNMQVDFT